MDQIRIQNLEVFGHHGVFSEEKALGQKFLVNAVLYLDVRRAGRSDDLHQSVHYGEVCHYMTRFMQEHCFRLIESVAEQMAEALLLDFPRLMSIDLEIKKPWAPIGLPIETVSVQISRSWHEAALGIGSNLGDRQSYLDHAVGALRAQRLIRDVRTSDWIETEPYGYTQQERFLNGAVCLQTLFTPEELLEVLHEIEQAAGRERTVHWGPRTLDLDLLLYDDVICETPELIVPHADMENRMFVLEPLAQLVPGRVHPVTGKTILRMKRELEEALR